MLIESYRRHLAASVLVLSELKRDEPVNGSALREHIHEKCRRASEKDPTFDFVGWAGTTFWEFLDVLASSRFLGASGPLPRSMIEWDDAGLLLTIGGTEFIEEVRPHVIDLLGLFTASEAGSGARSVA